ncbi:unnamed protein product, partial [Aphanomyces euteiches]
STKALPTNFLADALSRRPDHDTVVTAATIGVIHSELHARIRAAYASETWCSSIIAKITARSTLPARYSIREGLLYTTTTTLVLSYLPINPYVQQSSALSTIPPVADILVETKCIPPSHVLTGGLECTKASLVMSLVATLASAQNLRGLSAHPSDLYRSRQKL